MAVSGDWTYTESGGNATITDYSGCATPTIPTSLDGYPVIAIAANAMKSKSLISLTINHTINLDDECFANNAGLSVTINASVTTTVTASVPPFEGCSIGSNLTINSGCTSLPPYLFYNCGLTSISLNHAMNLDDLCFANNTGIDVVLNANVTTTGVNNTSAPFDGCSIGSGLTITSNVTTIPSYLFYNAGLTSVTFPSSVATIGNYSFQNNSIGTLTLDHAMNLNPYCFWNNSGIDVVLDANVTTTGVNNSTYPFSGCSIGSGLTITSNVTSIPAYLFYNCGLTSVTLSSSVTSIGQYAFSYNSISTLTLDHVMNLDDACFANNTGIDVVLNANVTTSVLSSSPPFGSCSIGSGLTINSGCTTIATYLFYNAGLTSLTLPSSVTTISDYAFSYNSITNLALNYAVDLGDECFASNNNLTLTINANVTTSAVSSNSYPPFESCNITNKATITSNVTSLPSYLFCRCGLTSIIVPNTITAFGTNQFAYNPNLATIYIYSISFTSTNALTDNMSVETPGIIYGYAGSSAQTLADAYATYGFVGLVDIEVNMDVGTITFSGENPSVQIPISVSMDVGLITFAGQNISLINSMVINMDVGTITFTGKNITTTYENINDDSDNMDLFLLTDFI